MCGIAGIVDFRGFERAHAEDTVRRMTDALHYRGPDEAGCYVDDCVALGHRRLAIIDLGNGQQPMSALSGQVQIVFNGEIYNFPELRAELEARGHCFRTRCDTEVILLGYVEWGEHCIERLNGMFAFAIWDARTRRLLMARDRVGKKPLYYCHQGARVAFASELKALRLTGSCPDSIDAESLDCYFSLGYVPAPRTIYRGVKKLRAGHYLTISEAGASEHRYWRLNFAPVTTRPLAQARDEFAALLDEAVRCRLTSDVPLGAFLSGGIDSSLVVDSMARLMQRSVVTNSIGFNDAAFNELPLARIVATELNTEHHEFVVKPNITDVLAKIAWHFDEPLADSSAVPTWYVCQMAKRTVTVALSGDGGDESFGGYTFRYLPHAAEARVRAALPALLRQAVFGTLGALWPASEKHPRPQRHKTKFYKQTGGDAEAFYRDLAWLRPDTRTSLYTPDFKGELRGFTPMELVQAYYGGNDAGDALGRSQYTDIHCYMTDDVLVKVDRMSMAHSLEVRCPLLDHRIIEFAARLPTRLKIDARRGKLVPRALAAHRLPAQVLSQSKRGFSIPAARWLREDLRATAEELLFDRNRLVTEVLDTGGLRRMWQEHQRATRDHSVFLWGVMMLGLWADNFYQSANPKA